MSTSFSRKKKEDGREGAAKRLKLYPHPMDSGVEKPSSSVPNDASEGGKSDIDALLMTDENLSEFDDLENVPVLEEDLQENYKNKLNDIGDKPSTAGWFVSEGQSVLLAYADGSCSFYDIVNSEEKAEYKPPPGVSPNMWRDCWITSAPSGDGCSGKYVVAASAGNSLVSGFCAWDFYEKDVRTFHFDSATNTPPSAENQQWWYEPCGPLIGSTASCQRMVQIYDIRDGEQLFKWELQKPVNAMDYSSPLHWRNRGQVVIAESDAISLWDVSSPTNRALQSVSSSGQKISALHVNNADVEPGGGVRQRMKLSTLGGNEGVFCTGDSINILDFRHPSGIALTISKIAAKVQSTFSCGDLVYIGCSSTSSQCSEIQVLSMRKQSVLGIYRLPESNAHYSFTALTQVWGSESLVMGICGLGLFVFDGGSSLPLNMGPDNMNSPSFDYSAPRVLLISGDRPACWRYFLL